MVFLGTCLAFAESALGTIVTLTDADATLVAGFALAALGMVLTALVAMYWKDPAFLTLSGEQALDLRRFEALAQKLPVNLSGVYSDEFMRMFLAQGGQFDVSYSHDEDSDESDQIASRLEDILSDGELEDENDELLG